MANFTFTPTSGTPNRIFNWNTTLNWDPARIPGVGDDVTFAAIAPADTYDAIDDIGTETIGDLSVGSFVRVFVGVGNSLTVSNISVNNGVVQVDDGSTLTIEAGGNAAGRAYALFHGSMFDPGDVTGDGATFTLTSGTLEIGGSFVGSEFDVLNSSFSDSNVMIFDAPPASTLPNQISGIRVGDKIELGGITFNAADYSGTTLTLMNGANSVYSMTDVTLNSSTSPSLFTFGTDPSTGDPFIQFAACFAAGTHILTIDGERPAEQLQVGDLLATHTDNGVVFRRLKWIGHRHLDLTRHADPDRIRPIRISRAAVSDGVPKRDLLVSPDHAVYLDGKLIPAHLLVNEATIIQDQTLRSVHYLHLELDEHAILLSEELTTESYLDTGNRGMFENGGVSLSLHSVFDAIGQERRMRESVAPLALNEADVKPHWDRLAERAAVFGFARFAPDIATDPELRVVVGEHSLAPISRRDGVYVFALPAGVQSVRLVSRADAPYRSRPWVTDRRPLGVTVCRIVTVTRDDRVELPLDHPTLKEGWWDMETSRETRFRWTNGDAVLPTPSRQAALLELHGVHGAFYRRDTAPPPAVKAA